MNQPRSAELFPRIQYCYHLLSVSYDFGCSRLNEIIRLTVGCAMGGGK